MDEGVPQGGPLSPLLSNLMLDVLDKELERRGHRFARYADDCNIYVRSPRAGERVMASITRFLERRLKLRVNTAKSAVASPAERKFLGFSFMDQGRPGGASRRRRSPDSRSGSGNSRHGQVGAASRRSSGTIPLPHGMAWLLRLLRDSRDLRGWTNGSDDGSVPSSGSSGSMGVTASRNCAVVGSEGAGGTNRREPSRPMADQ